MPNGIFQETFGTTQQPPAKRDAALRVELERAAKDAVMTGASWLTEQEVYSFVNARAVDVPQDIARIWRGQGKIFAIERGPVQLYAAYQFTAAEVPNGLYMSTPV